MTPLTDRVLDRFTRAGPWALLALLLILVMVYEIRPAIADQARQTAAIRAEHNEFRAEFNSALNDVLQAIRHSAYLEFRNCINTANNDDQRLLCAYKE